MGNYLYEMKLSPRQLSAVLHKPSINNAEQFICLPHLKLSAYKIIRMEAKYSMMIHEKQEISLSQASDTLSI